MRYTFIDPDRPAGPTLGGALRESVVVADLLDVFETFAVAGHELVATANAVYAARRAGDVPATQAFETARAAARRVLAACDAADGGGK